MSKLYACIFAGISAALAEMSDAEVQQLSGWEPDANLECPHCGCTLGLFIARDGFPYAYCPHCGHAWDDEGASIDD